MTDTLLLLDGNSLAYRAFFALPTSIVTSTGQITNAVYGFTSMLLKALEDFKPQYLGAAFDMSRPTFRLNEFADYKGTRKSAPPGLRDQITWSKYRKDTFDFLRSAQSSDGSWSGSGSWGGIGPVYATAMGLTIMQLDKATLPLYQK